MDKRFTFHLKREWFDLIWSGDKTVEYREIKPHWTKMTAALGQSFRATFVAGYVRGGRRVEADVFKVDIGPCPYEGWSGDYYRFHFRAVKRIRAASKSKS